MASSLNFSFIQANLDHSKRATGVLIDRMNEGDFDFALLSDPYVRGDAIPGLDSDWPCIAAQSKPRVAVLVRKVRWDVFPLFVSQRVVAVSCSGLDLTFVVVSVYAPPHQPFAPVLDDLRRCLFLAGAVPTVVGGDFNAKHAAWGSDLTDARGGELLRFAVGSGLLIVNDPASPPTYSNAYVDSWLDVTLATPSMVLAGLRWGWRRPLLFRNTGTWRFALVWAPRGRNAG